jgi:hypothetical protein
MSFLFSSNPPSVLLAVNRRNARATRAPRLFVRLQGGERRRLNIRQKSARGAQQLRQHCRSRRLDDFSAGAIGKSRRLDVQGRPPFHPVGDVVWAPAVSFSLRSK